jgi:hypothetical protein
MLFSISVSLTNKHVNHTVIFELKKLYKKMETIHPFSRQVALLYQRWLGKRLFSDKRL